MVAGVLLLLIGIAIGRLTSPEESHDHETEEAASTADSGDEDSTTWTCSMHPQIQQSEPGDCPICGMDLIPLDEDEGGDQGARTMSMSESSRALAEIQTTQVRREFAEANIRLVGKLDYDETREKTLAARFPARIEQLYVNYTGVRVERGEHLAEVYSPELLTAQRELLTAHERDPDSIFTAAARGKLRLWDLLPEQIDEIIERGEARDRFVLRAPVSGVVVTKNVKEGDYLSTGESLFRIVDLSELWLTLDAYESDLSWLRYGQEVEFTVESHPGEQFSGQISFIEPEINRKTRTVPVRVTVPNPNEDLKPGMFARGIVKSRIAEDGHVYAPDMEGKWISPMHPQVVKDEAGNCDICGMPLVPAEELMFVSNDGDTRKPPLVVPTSAVLRTGKRSVAYVKVPDAERPTYEGREIVLGPKAGDSFIVKSGLEEGEEVVTNGAFKIDSALQIQAKPSMMSPEGGGAPGGHDHGEQQNTGEGHSGQEMEMDTLELDVAMARDILPDYLNLQEALADDDLETAKESLKALMELTGHSGPVAELIHKMVAEDDLVGVREPHFATLSNAMIQAIKTDPGEFSGELLLMHCPMALDNAGADWIQSEEPLRNPYFGEQMLKCGEIKSTLSSQEDMKTTD